MFRILSAVVTTDRVRIALAGAAIALAFKTISQVMEARVEYLAQLENAIADRHADLAALDRDVVEKATAAQYPTREDLDPLGAGLD